MYGSDKLRAFVSWSGGKDAAVSYYRVSQEYQVTHLVNMVAENGRVSRSHGIRTDMLRMQGYFNVKVYRGGWDDWTEREQPVREGEKP